MGELWSCSMPLICWTLARATSITSENDPAPIGASSSNTYQELHERPHGPASTHTEYAMRATYPSAASRRRDSFVLCSFAWSCSWCIALRTSSLSYPHPLSRLPPARGLATAVPCLDTLLPSDSRGLLRGVV